MIPLKFFSETWRSPNSASLIQKIAIALLFGATGAALNLTVLFPIYGQLSIHLGQAFAIVCLVVFGLRAGIFAAIISTTGLLLADGSILFFPILLLEIVTIHLLRKRGCNTLVSDLVYWLVIGVPIAFTFIHLNTELPQDYIFLAVIKQLLNGLLCALLASIIFMLMPFKRVSHVYRDQIPTLSQRIFHLLNVSIILPSLCLALIFTYRSSSELQNQIEMELQEDASQLRVLIDNHIEKHQQLIEGIANSYRHIEKSEQLQTLTDFQLAFPSFITMLTTDKFGKVEIAAPSSVFETLRSLPDTQRIVADRVYFSVPKETLQMFLSNAFLGRGVGSDPIVAISAPIIRDNTFKGIIEGSLNLSFFSKFEEQVGALQTQEFVVVTDAENKVLHASSALNINPLSNFDPDMTVDNAYSEFLAVTKINNEEFLFSKAENSYGWHVYALVNPSSITKAFIENLLILGLTLFVISSIFLFVTKRFANQIIAPLNLLAKRFKAKGEQIEIKHTTKEIMEISEQLDHAKYVMEQFNIELEREVDKKTQELLNLNTELLRLSNEDPLTHLPNRRYFNEQASSVIKVNARNNQPMSLAVIDVDNFKQINDNYGHQVGDQSLILVANSINRHFNRDSDLCARYGGDEFVVLIASGSSENQIATFKSFIKYMKSIAVELEGRNLPISISVGTVHVEGYFNVTLESMMKQADQMMYQSKALGRNRMTSMKL